MGGASPCGSAAMAVRMLSGRFSVFGRRLLIARATGRLYSTQNSESLSLLTDYVPHNTRIILLYIVSRLYQ